MKSTDPTSIETKRIVFAGSRSGAVLCPGNTLHSHPVRIDWEGSFTSSDRFKRPLDFTAKRRSRWRNPCACSRELARDPPGRRTPRSLGSAFWYDHDQTKSDCHEVKNTDTREHKHTRGNLLAHVRKKAASASRKYDTGTSAQGVYDLCI